MKPILIILGLIAIIISFQNCSSFESLHSEQDTKQESAHVDHHNKPMTPAESSPSKKQ